VLCRAARSRRWGECLLNSQLKSTAIALMGAILTLLVPASASAYSSAPLTFCNKSSADVALAVGYHSPGVSDPADHSLLTGPFVSRGWWAVGSGACVTADNPFNARYMFWFVIGPEVKNLEYPDVVAMRNPALPDHFCITSFFDRGGRGVTGFTFEDENTSADACDQAGGNPDANGERSTLWINPRNIDTWVNATVNFTGQ
jgi:uncharacterized membrane protein